ncbi:NAD-dependent epimerase/dehydratase family protein [Cytophagaceae bacterium YF14B1]|uniref:NAD-dependent epimerase/dehydratase family protein n=1 Tax=Xanthocytophaga flava TaxID=3048013 RepID=A0AAE3QNX2_9BACT|nr:NAD-dependent epimerase/dehydratase family protein [Xanthocytophaga flavus]MDJ1482166.1 NAD-dependent epimerase/dehydratase family protein [Xanthocytophaga flavus]
MKHCCIIGGTGFIGRHLVDVLLKSGRKITVIGRAAQPVESLPESVQYIQNRVNDEEWLTNVLEEVDEIVDLAYSTTPQTSFVNPVNDILSNLPGTVQLFAIASKLSIRKFIWVSSGGTVYGNVDQTPITENFLTNPVSPYGITKLAIEKYARMYFELAGLPIVCVRPANAYGEGQQPFRGQGFVATAIATILNRQSISIFGEDGTIRDYIHVADIALAIEAALDRGISGEVYNIGTGIGKTNRQVIDTIRKYANDIPIEINTLPARKFDVASNILDYSKLHHQTGWKPEVSFEKGIERTWEWFVKQPKFA